MKLTEIKREKWKKLTMCMSLVSQVFQLNQHNNKLLQFKSQVVCSLEYGISGCQHSVLSEREL